MRFFIFICLLFYAVLVYAQKNFNIPKDMQNIIDIEWENAQVIDHPVYGVLILSKDRWKNWVFRSLIILMIYVSVASITLSIPKTSDINFAASYILCGALFVISFWLTLSGWMLMRLENYKYGWIFVTVSLPLYLGSYMITMVIKNKDISYEKIKDEIRRLKEEEMKNYEDPRLYAISGEYGEWEDEDFIRHS